MKQQKTPPILITGASSYVGARIFLDLKKSYHLVGTYFTHPLSSSFLQLNLADKEAIAGTLRNVRPNVVVHVANFPSPRSAINNEEQFLALNEKATTYLVDAANSIGAKVVFISSQAANNPDNIYGKLKAKSEEYIHMVKAGYCILRPSLLVGLSPNTTSPRPFNRILQCLDDRTMVGEFDISWKLQPSYVGHVSQVIARVIDGEMWNTIIPTFINESITQYQIAHDILKYFDVSVRPIDQHISIPLSKDDLRAFDALKLSPHSYQEMIQVIVEEIKSRKKFTLETNVS